MDFERGMQLNVHALIRLLDACRAQANAPRLLFASSIASFGGTPPAVVDDHTHQTPQTSYGVHKVIAEQLINNYSRRSFIDGRGLRLPIVLTHPGPPSASVSDRVAALIREPLQGGSATCPVAPDAPLAVASVERVVATFLQLAELPASVFGATCAMNLPALAATPAQIVEAVRRRNPELPNDCIRRQSDPVLQRVVDGWPSVSTSQLVIEYSHDYRTAAPFADKNVLVVGIGNSAVDIAVDVCKQAQSALLSTRRSAWTMPKYLLSVPIDRWSAFVGRKPKLPTRSTRSLMRWLLVLAVGDQRRFGVPRPQHPIWREHATLSQELLPYLGHGWIRFEITQGEPVIGGLHGDAQHIHCPHCKRWMFRRPPQSAGDFVNVRATMLDAHGWFVPFMETYTSEKLPSAFTPAVRSFDKFPAVED